MRANTVIQSDSNLTRRAMNDERLARKRRAFMQLSDRERVHIEGCVTYLEGNIRGLGRIGAFELIGALGEWLARQPEVKHE